MRKLFQIGFKLGVFWGLLSILNGCAGLINLPFGNQNQQHNNPIRQVVVAETVQQFGVTDEVVINFDRSEARVNFEAAFEREVWVYPLGQGQYFDLMPPERSFIFVDRIDYKWESMQAQVRVYHSNSESLQEIVYQLAYQNGVWQIIEPLEG